MIKSPACYCLYTTYALIGSTVLVGGPVHAQSGATGNGADAIALEEIVVTAERRTQNLQKAPLAVSVREGDDLVAQGRISLDQILEDVPSVNWKPNTGAVAHSDTESTSISIRGIGSNDATSYTSVVPAVALYVDGVVGGLGGDYDLERVEILRGPQGTLYGRSATAGVVNIHAKDPNTDSFAAELAGEFGSYDLRRFSAGINLPATDKFAVRISGQHRSREGYYSPKGEETETNGVRLKALYALNDDLSLVFGVAQEKNLFHSGGEQINVTPSGVNFDTVAPVGNGDDLRNQYWGKLEWNLGFANLTYLPAVRTYTKNEDRYTILGSNLLTDHHGISRDIFHTQELRLASPAGERLSWQSGLFYYDNQIRNNYDLVVSGGTFASPYALQIGNKEKQTRNLGVFTEGTYAFDQGTRLTAGIRYDLTRLEIEQLDCSGPVGGPQSCVSISGQAGEKKWNNTTFKLRVEHDLAADNLVYGTIASAFLPGDVAIVTGADGNLMISPYLPETLTSYEVGTKNRFWDERLQVNAGVYYYDYGGYQQRIQIGEFQGVALNAIKNSPARVMGAELEAVLQPSRADRIEFNASYTDANYVDKPADFAAAVSQKSIPGIVPFEATLSYGHDFGLPFGQRLTLKAEAAYRSALDVGALTPAQAASAVISSLVRQEDVVIGNVYATWRASDVIAINAYVRNISDERYKTLVSTNGESTSLSAQLSEPRTAGIVLNVRF